MAGGEAWPEVTPDVGQVASGGGCGQRHDRGQTLTDQDTDVPSRVGSLLDQIDDPIVQVTADGAYDGARPHIRRSRSTAMASKL
jgi:hypothetical protein